MTGSVYAYLSDDHARLDSLLRQAVAQPGQVDKSPYALFRAGLLRHIGMEEKILLPTARRLRGGEPLPITAQLRRDHAALAALLVPTPTPEIVGTIRKLLEKHNELEERPDGLYETCERLAANELDALTAKLQAAPEVALAPHADGPRVQQHIQQLLDAAWKSREE